MAEVLDLENERLLLRDDVGEGCGESIGNFAAGNHDLVFLQNVPVRARHLCAVGSCAGEGNERIAGNTSDHEGVMLRATGMDDDGIGGTQAIERGDADFMEVGPNLAEEDFPLLKFQLV